MTSREVSKLAKAWQSSQNWPKFLNYIEINGIRGWTGQRVELKFPIVAIVGENGAGKSTILQSAACCYRDERQSQTYFPTEFFPETAWDTLTDVSIKYGHRVGQDHREHSIRKPTSRWLGQPERPERPLIYLDLSRLQPVGSNRPIEAACLRAGFRAKTRA